MKFEVSQSHSNQSCGFVVPRDLSREISDTTGLSRDFWCIAQRLDVLNSNQEVMLSNLAFNICVLNVLYFLFSRYFLYQIRRNKNVFVLSTKKTAFFKSVFSVFNEVIQCDQKRHKCTPRFDTPSKQYKTWAPLFYGLHTHKLQPRS